MADPARAALGAKTFEEVLGIPCTRLDTPFREAARDYVFAEVWSRPGLDRRSRFWITLAAVAATGVELATRTYLNAALGSGEITEPELREFVLQFAVFQGNPKAAELERLLDETLAARASKQV